MGRRVFCGAGALAPSIALENYETARSFLGLVRCGLRRHRRRIGRVPSRDALIFLCGFRWRQITRMVPRLTLGNVRLRLRIDLDLADIGDGKAL